MAVKTAPASYFRLVERFPLASIRDDAHLKRAQAILDELLRARPDKAGLTHHFSGLTHHNSELRITGKPCLLVKPKLLDHIFAMFR
jgi:hypothetical protein